MLITLLFIAVCFLAYSNGANDNFKGVASLYGSGSASYRLALSWATITTLAGSCCAFWLAQSLLIKFSGKGLAPDALIQSIPFMTAIASGAGLTVILATRLGFPISTTHALLGAMAGSTLVATGTLNFTALQSNFMLPLLLSPMLAVLLAMLVYVLFRQARQRTGESAFFCLCVENQPSLTSATIKAESGAMVLRQSEGLQLSVDTQAACNSRYAGTILGIDVHRIVDSLHFISAGAVCFARGLNDTPKIAALLLLAPGFDPQPIMLLVALAMAVGGLLNARRVAETMSHKITAISHGQGLTANLTTALLVIFASKWGLPVSTTHVSVGALFGMGLITRQAQVRMITSILLSWVLTLPCAGLCAAGIYALYSEY
ncbi:MAG: inorganic phosphate transporter [Methylococcaceae bacterium]|nr:inorganic phosphate transporter [Methylococcaceae bacterium]